MSAGTPIDIPHFLVWISARNRSAIVAACSSGELGSTTTNSSPPSAPNQIELSAGLEEDLGDLGENSITGGMPESVIDLFEMVEIDQDN